MNVKGLLLLAALLLCVAAVSAAVDDSYTKSLLHFDGADGSTTFTDESGKTWARTAAVIETNQSIYGGASGYFNGAANISTGRSADFNFTTGDFTIDAWVRSSSVTMASDIEGIFGSADNNLDSFVLYNGRLTWRESTVYRQGWTVLSNNTWYHVAVTRSSGTARLFVNGKLNGSWVDGGNYNYSLPSVGRLNAPTTIFMGNIDELRVSKGKARWITNFTPPSYPYGLTDSEHITNATTVHLAPLTVQFNDTSLDSTWSVNTWNWTFGDGVVSSLQNPTRTYAAPGSYNINLTTTNLNQSSTSLSVINVGSPYVDFVGTPTSGSTALLVTFAWNGANISPITTYNISYGDGYYGDGVPPWSHTYTSIGNFDVNVSATGSSGGTGYSFKDGYISTRAERTEWYNPTSIKFTVVNDKRVPIVGAYVNATAIGTTFPSSTTWLEDMYGIDSTAAGQMINSTLTMNGTSKSDGGVTFTMHPSVEYLLVVTEPLTGVSRTLSVMPDERTYTITLAGVVPTRNSTYRSLGANTSLYAVPVNTTEVLLGLKYQDMSGLTDQIWFYVYNKNGVGLVYTEGVAVSGSDMIYLNYTVPNVKHDVYGWYYQATRTV